MRATPDLSAQEEDACPTGPCLTARLSQSSPQICWRWLSWTARRWRISLSDEGSPGINPHELCAPSWESLTARAGLAVGQQQARDESPFAPSLFCSPWAA